MASFRATVQLTILKMGNEIMPEQIEWLWKRWIARSKLHLIAGRPGAGKSQIALSLAATISSGERWPDGTRAQIGNVLIWTSEDGGADTVIPRLTRMGADLTRIGFPTDHYGDRGKIRPFNPATDMQTLAITAANMGGVSLLILDPVVAAVPPSKNSHNNAETRSGLQPVIDFAEAANCAVIGITHFTKGTAGQDTTERVTGSPAFGAVARIVMAASKCEDENSPSPRVLVLAKNNVGKDDGGFGYDIEEGPISYEQPDFTATRILWLDPVEGSAKTVLNEAENDTKAETKVEQAKRFLKDALVFGEKGQQAIEAEAKASGISADALKRASSIVFKRKDGRGGWFWRME
jgi:putative DNA primase/helicase